MANRYWRGGSGSWTSSSTANWSTTSGGAGGASVPTAADIVIFDANSGVAGAPFTVTISGTTYSPSVLGMTFTPVSNAGTTILSIAGTGVLTIGASGLSTSSTSGNKRFRIQGPITTNGATLTGANLQINGAVSISDVDFSDIGVYGSTSLPITGTRIGNLGNCENITFSASKTVYWNLAGTQNFNATGWAATSGASPADSNFPLAQDTAVIDNTGSAGTITLVSGIAYPTIDASTRTTAATIDFSSNTQAFYGSLLFGSGLTVSGVLAQINFFGSANVTITSAGKTLPGNVTIWKQSGSVSLSDACIISYSFLVYGGTFNTNNYALTTNSFTGSSIGSGYGPATMNLGSSTWTVTAATNATFGLLIGGIGGFTFNAGTSNIVFSNPPTIQGTSGEINFYNVTITSIVGQSCYIYPATGYPIRFNNLTVTPPPSTGVAFLRIGTGAIIYVNGTLSCTGGSQVRRLSITSDTVGTQRTLSVGTLATDYCDYTDIALTGTATGSSPTNAGNGGNTTGITFPAPKTVYWNLAGAVNISDVGWAATSGGAPALANFPLAQDTMVFDNAGAATAVTSSALWTFGTVSMGTRTTAMTLTVTSDINIVGNWTFGTGVSCVVGAGAIIFRGRGTQTIVCNGVSFANSVLIDNTNPTAISGLISNGIVQLGDAFFLTGTSKQLQIVSGTFRAITYNVTTPAFVSGSGAAEVRMGSGTWSLTGTATVWSNGTTNFYAETANIILTDTSTTNRAFSSTAFTVYNKVTIGGATGTSTTSFSGSGNNFQELASTKTVAHTLSFGANTCNFGRWTITGTAGNVVTIVGNSSHVLLCGAVTGIDYLAMGSFGFSATDSRGEFYAGANSTGTAAAPVYRTAAPAPRILYWVGGTGNWSATTSWSTASGGGSGAAIPTSLDSVIFDSASSAASYTATVDATARCASLTMGGPASGSVSLAGSSPLAINGTAFFASGVVTATTFTGIFYLGGYFGGSYTLTSNGVTFKSTFEIGVWGVTWTLGSALNCGTGFTYFSPNYGTINTAGYAVTCDLFASAQNANPTLNLGASTITAGVTVSGSICSLSKRTVLNPGTSTIVLAGPTGGNSFGGNNLTYYNVTFNVASSLAPGHSISGRNTFTNLTINTTSNKIVPVSLSSDQTITGTLTVSGASARARAFLYSSSLQTRRTLTVGTLSAAYADFRDIAIAGAAAGATPTGAGDCGNNTGITFSPAPTTLYWNLAGTQNFSAIGWATSSGGVPNSANFPRAQDTIVFDNAGAISAFTAEDQWNIGTVSASTRTTAMTYSHGVGSAPIYYGGLVTGTGVSFSGTMNLTFSGRGTYSLGLANVISTGAITINNAQTMQLVGNIVSNSGTLLITCTQFDANSYSINFSSINAQPAILNMGSGTWTATSTGGVFTFSTSGVVNKQTANLVLDNILTSSRTFSGGNKAFNKLTIGGPAGTTGTSILTISGGNSFTEIASTKTVAHTINFPTSPTLIGAWTASGSAGNLLTIQSAGGATSPAALVYTSAGGLSGVNYLVPTNLRGYPLTGAWYIGANSTRLSELGFFYASLPAIYNVSVTEFARASDSIAGTNNMIYAGAVAETVRVSELNTAAILFRSNIADTTRVSDSVAAKEVFSSRMSDTARASDTTAARATFGSSVADTVNATDSTAAKAVFGSSVANTVNVSDSPAAKAVFGSAVSNTANATDSIAAKETLYPAISEQATASQTNSAAQRFSSAVSNTANATDTTAARATFRSTVSNTANATDSTSAKEVFGSAVSNSATASDSVAARELLYPAISEQAAASQTNSAAQRFGASVSNTANASQTNAASAVFRGSVTATVNVSDSPSSKAVFGSAVSNTVTVANTTAAAQRFGTSVSEQAKASQTNSAAQSFRTAVSEQANSSQTNSAAQGFTSNVTAQATAHDADSASVVFNGAVSNSATATDAVASRASLGSSLSETATANDATSAAATFRTNIQDSVQVTDQDAASVVFQGTVVEVATAHDTDAVAASTFNAYNAETANASETTLSKASFGSNVSNTVNASDSDVGRIQFPGSISESATALDSTSAAQRFATAIAESSQASNIFSAIASFKSTVTNTARASQTNAAKASFGAAVTNTAQASQTTTGRTIFGAAVSDTANASDSDVGYIRFPGAISETAQSNEQTAAQAAFARRISEAAAASEFVATNFQVEAVASETAQASSANAANQGFGSAVSETATANGATAARAIFQGIIQEAVQGSDQFSATAVFLAAFSEFAQAYEQNAGFFVYAANVTNTASASDTATAQGQLRGYISESGTADEATAAKLFFASIISESAVGLDSVDAPGSTYNAVVSDSAQATDSPTAGAIFYAAVIAYAGITDAATARYLWELIDDSQTANWQNIPNSQSASWVEINDAQTPNWVRITP